MTLWRMRTSCIVMLTVSTKFMKMYSSFLWPCTEGQGMRKTRGVLRYTKTPIRVANGKWMAKKGWNKNQIARIFTWLLRALECIYPTRAEFIVQYFMTTNDFRSVKRDDPYSTYKKVNQSEREKKHTRRSDRNYSGKPWLYPWGYSSFDLSATSSLLVACVLQMTPGSPMLCVT